MSTFIQEIKIDLGAKELYIVWNGPDTFRNASGPIKWKAHAMSRRLTRGKHLVNGTSHYHQPGNCFRFAIYFGRDRTRQFLIHAEGKATAAQEGHGCIAIPLKEAEKIHRYSKVRKTKVHIS
ncbi:MAG: hypothetical protein AAF206_14015 [Bacteroidota bacterium]